MTWDCEWSPRAWSSRTTSNGWQPVVATWCRGTRSVAPFRPKSSTPGSTKPSVQACTPSLAWPGPRRSPPAPEAGFADSGQALRLVLAQEPLEQAAVALLVVEDLDHHVLGHQVLALAELDDPVVVLYGAGLGLDHALDHVHDVRLLGR